MTGDGELSFELGILRAQYESVVAEGNLDEEFTIYDSFDDIHIDQKPYLRRLARLRGRIDALSFLVNGERPPENYAWLDSNPETLRSNLREVRTRACTRRGDSGNTWTEYLRGWIHSATFALERASEGQ